MAVISIANGNKSIAIIMSCLIMFETFSSLRMEETIVLLSVIIDQILCFLHLHLRITIVIIVLEILIAFASPL